MKKKSYLIILVLLCTLFPACQKSEEEVMLEQALELAGPNRAELQKVLDHYTGDSLKLEAAKFLIKYMPGHFSYVDTAAINRYALAVDSVIENMKEDRNNDAMRDSIDRVAQRKGINSLKIVQDCQIITADYLIQNIDIAFYDWQHGPWAKHVCFEDFCEWILPYKADDLQPLDNWRSRLKTFLSEKLTELEYCDQLRNSAYAAVKNMNRTLADSINPKMGTPIRYANIPTEHRAKLPFGRCDDYVSMAATIFRSHGIPVVVHFTPQWAKRSLGHTWNVLLSDDGKNIPFDGITGQIGQQTSVEEVMTKIYRRTYSPNIELVRINNSGEFVPKSFRNVFIRDVTRGIIKCSDVTLKIESTPNKYAYLLAFDNQEWVPVAYGTIKNNKATFKDVGENAMYLPVIYVNAQMKPIAEPFILDHNGKVRKKIPDMKRKMEMKLTRKFPTKERTYEFVPRLKDGEFQASNDANFKKYYVVHRIQEGKASGQHVNIPDSIPPCRYWRYTNNRYSTFCSIAEVMFYAKGDTTRLLGQVIGTDGSWYNNPEHLKETVFDGNTLTSFDAPRGEGCWAGLDLGKPMKVDHLIYYGRGDGNSVEIGDEYELFYWNDKWVSMGRKRAKNVFVKYKGVPQNALYLLRDLTKGTEERIFTYENGKQVWW